MTLQSTYVPRLASAAPGARRLRRVPPALRSLLQRAAPRRLAPPVASRAAALVASLASLASLAATPCVAPAQVGYEPSGSPFEDLEYRQSISILGGYFRAGRDAVGVAPRGGALGGVQYDIFLAGPASFTARLATIASERTVIDPARDANERAIGTEQRPLTALDVGFNFALTGQKSWRRIVPLVHAGVGVVSNFQSADVGGYRFGTAFALAYGVGARYVPVGRRVALRADLGWRLYQVRYPDQYYRTGLDGTSVLAADASRSSWLNNLSATLGLSYQFKR